MRKVITAHFMFLLIALTLIPIAAATDGYGNEWVYDEAQVISGATEAYIKQLNEDVFSSYKNKPQLAIVVVNDLPYNIDDYKRELFNDYGIGTAEENCGMLFLFALNDRVYGFEIGDGFRKGSILRDTLEYDFIAAKMKDDLKAGDYDAVVFKIAQHIATIMADEEAGVYAEKEARKQEIERAQAERAAKDREESAKRAQAARAALVAGLKKAGIALCIACPPVGIGYLALRQIQRNRRKKKISELIEKNYKYLSMAKVTNEELERYALEEFQKAKLIEIEQQFLKTLYNYYYRKQISSLCEQYRGARFLEKYKNEFRQENGFAEFQACRITRLEDIVSAVDEEETKREALRQKNREIVDEFLAANENRIDHPGHKEKIRRDLYTTFAVTHMAAIAEDVEAHFTKRLRELNFEWEMDAFIRENAEQASGQYFDRESFYREIQQTDGYKHYQYNPYYDRSWMYPLMISHMSRRKKAHQEELRRQEEARRRREREEMQRREAARKRQAEQLLSNNSSFGSGFGGGRSSGGGFKGGW